MRAYRSVEAMQTGQASRVARPPAGGLQRLQASAGNHAVTQLVRKAGASSALAPPGPAEQVVVQRDITLTGDKAKPTWTVDELLDRLASSRAGKSHSREEVRDAITQFDGQTFASYAKLEDAVKKVLRGPNVQAANTKDAVEAKLAKDGAGLTVDDVKQYLAFNETQTTPLYRDMAIRIRDATYGAKEPFTEEAVKAAIIASTEKARANEARNRRGIPEQYHEGTFREMSGPEKEQLRVWLTARLPKLAASPAGGATIVKLATDPQLISLGYVLREVIRSLSELDPFWHALKPSAQLSLCEQVQKVTDIAGAKGVLGEVRGALYAVRRGSVNVNVGKKKTLPATKQAVFAKATTAEVDVSFTEGGQRIFVEAKFDMGTFIDKYRDVEKTIGMAKQQMAYKLLAERDKAKRSSSGPRAVGLVVGDTHDWLLLFIPGGSGTSVLKRIAADSWFIVIGRETLDAGTALKLQAKVASYCQAHGIAGPDRERWAERESRGTTPRTFLALPEDVAPTTSPVTHAPVRVEGSELPAGYGIDRHQGLAIWNQDDRTFTNSVDGATYRIVDFNMPEDWFKVQKL